MNNTAENLMEPCEEAPVYVIGHMNPDTDSICSAIAYAYLKEKVNGKPYYPRRAGQLNLETKYVLERFGFQEPFYLADVRRQVKDMDVRKFKRVLSCLSLKKAWEWMADLDVVTLPIVDGEGKLEGLITERDIAKSYMEMNDPAMLSKALPPTRTSRRLWPDTWSWAILPMSWSMARYWSQPPIRISWRNILRRAISLSPETAMNLNCVRLR